MIVYRLGNLTGDNFTPRPGKDTTGRPGQAPGLSTFETISLQPGQKVQGIDLDLLVPPLQGFPDDLAQGGVVGHVAIAPVDDSDKIDQGALDDWASFRGTGQTHPFTQIVLDAVTAPNLRKI